MSGNALMMWRGALTATLVLLMTGCASTVPSGTQTVCDALRQHLPSYSVADTERTKIEGAKFLDVFVEICA